MELPDGPPVCPPRPILVHDVDHTIVTPRDDPRIARRLPLRTLVAALLAGVAIAGCGSDRPATSPIASDAPTNPTHGCGMLSGPGATFTILTANGVTCSQAVTVFKDLFAGKGQPQTVPGTGQSGKEVDGWLCGGGAGGFGCGRNGRVIEAGAR